LIDVWKRLVATQPHDRERSGSGVALKRVLGVPGLIGVGLGTMLGGIFATIGVGMNAAGPGVILAFALSGLACVFVALCYAELAAMVPVAGSAYTYAYATLGEFVAWVIGWDLILEYGISVAPTAAAWSGYVQSFIGNYGITLPVWARVAHVATSGFGYDRATHHISWGTIDIAH
jgi:APA family basic amino acid/polyamine antiporter